MRQQIVEYWWTNEDETIEILYRGLITWDDGIPELVEYWPEDIGIMGVYFTTKNLPDRFQKVLNKIECQYDIPECLMGELNA